jgi:outer membrane protein
MKKIIVAGLCTLACVSSFAGGLGVVNVKTLIATSPQAKAINSDLKKKFSSRKAQLEAQGNALQKRVADFNKNRSVMSKAKQKSTQESISKDSQDFQKARVAYQQDLMKTENDSMSAFIDKVKAATAVVAKTKKLDMVFPANVAIYSQPSVDITPDVMKALK